MRTFLLSLLLALSCAAATFQITTLRIGTLTAGSAPAPEEACSDANVTFTWHMEDADVTAGDPAGCSDGDTNGTANSSAVITNTVKFDGTYSLYCPSSADYYTFDVSGSDLFDTDEGTVTFNVYVTSAAAGATYFYVTTDGDNNFRVAQYNDGTVRVTHEAGADWRSVTSTEVVTNEVWTAIEAKWRKASSPYLSVKVGAADAVTYSTSALGDWVGSVPSIRVGEGVGTSTAFYIDNIKIYNNWQ